ncbi:hypothetical protein K3G63_01500 [Hymenobacter sp. HSC-4F20]|uniref:hypothetical protein n=1 Tax=Hymenobacter sp. HSC-4F20 TaxID=2864135 RepID=UPI001C72BCC8|nr:hypothetical protein [Hymenobacter sp. HSC-4F20]MBX0289091.1 hypothetical protein [Hymenobacter sp. HSC-4F20]
MTDSYLQSLGFAATDETRSAHKPLFAQAWRYQHHILAQDGALLFIEHPLGIDSCRLSAIAAPLSPQDVFASVSLQDRPALEAAITAFYAAHGGVGVPAPLRVTNTFLPFRRKE